MSGWQSIDTAPKDGTEFLAYFPRETPQLAVVRHEAYGDVVFFGYVENLLAEVVGEASGFTHWMPLPEAPHD